MANGKGGPSRRMIAFLGTAVLSILIAVLLYWELVSVLYVLATLALVALLLVVGWSDIEKVKVGPVDSEVD